MTTLDGADADAANAANTTADGAANAADKAPSEALFYHLVARPMEQTLPGLLERTMARGWRAVIRVGSPERLETLSRLLWTYRDNAFLPHGGPQDGFPDRQPIYLTCGAETPNGAQVQFLVDGGQGDLTAFVRSVLLFDARDDIAVAAARNAWRGLKTTNATATYWRQDDAGRWAKHAQIGPG